MKQSADAKHLRRRWTKSSGFQRKPSNSAAKAVALQALAEDAARDATSERCISPKQKCTARIIAKSPFMLCGVVEADAIFASRRVRTRWKFSEGQKVRRGSVVCRLSGNARGILACERIALNYLALLSGIATKSAFAARKYGRWRIAATRKTIPLLSSSEKRAVKTGGCLTHRMSLSDGILVKDNHIAAIMKERGIGWAEAIGIAVHSFPKRSFIEVEVSAIPHAIAAVKAGAKVILVDNVPPDKFAAIAKAARRLRSSVIIEASGGITLANAGKYLKAGATFCSTSELATRLSLADLSLRIDSF